MLVAGYIRVSTDEQAEHGHSLDAQETLIRQFAAQRGWQLVEIYRDAGLSGRSHQRPSLERLLHDAEAGRFEAVIVHAIDRLYRNLEALLKTLQLFQAHNIAFVSITENMDFTTPWGKLTLAVLGTLAEIYIDKLSAETSKGKQQRARKGLWNGSIPLGYCTGLCSHCTDPNGPGYCPCFGQSDQGDGQALIFHPIEQAAVTLAFTWYATGDYSDGQIAAKLNAYEHHLPDGTIIHFRTKSPSSRGGPGPFSKDSVRDILTRVFYTGMVPYYGLNDQGQKRKRRHPVALYPGQHPALIDQTTFDRAQEIRQLFGRNPRQRHVSPARLYPLSGLLRCGQCRGKMRAQTGSTGQRYYVCVTRLQRTGVCDQPAIIATDIERQVLDLLKHIRIFPDWQREVLRSLGQDPDELERQRTAIRDRLARATELYLAGVLTKVQFDEEEHLARFKLADLQNFRLGDIISAKEQLERLQNLSSENDDLTIKKLLRPIIAAVFARGNTLSAIQFTENSYPLLKQVPYLEDCFYSGSDGNVFFGGTGIRLTPPSLNKAPLYSPFRLVQELQLCPDEEFVL